ncbi:hypothetical protein GCWU000282_03283 [Catonella morbi ATCC 51271]|uniref:Uncharacterized protein n=1 Tax=Catonella morbi ATCC 51271 TaxID=592026 RepID=V2XH81_9FIRM|nr:hypothetical protein GCWU000282_03283 [Catonella morbi ATCC 51271]
MHPECLQLFRYHTLEVVAELCFFYLQSLQPCVPVSFLFLP